MIGENILLNFMERARFKTLGHEHKYADGFNEALNTMKNFVDKMPKIDPVFIKPHVDDMRDKLRDTEFERDFYKMHFEDLYRRKVEG